MQNKIHFFAITESEIHNLQLQKVRELTHERERKRVGSYGVLVNIRGVVQKC